jgi:hypothetical protein
LPWCWLCFHFFSPFLTMMLWALILAVTLYPLHQMLAEADRRQAGSRVDADRACSAVGRDRRADGHAGQFSSATRCMT